MPPMAIKVVELLARSERSALNVFCLKLQGIYTDNLSCQVMPSLCAFLDARFGIPRFSQAGFRENCRLYLMCGTMEISTSEHWG